MQGSAGKAGWARENGGCKDKTPVYILCDAMLGNREKAGCYVCKEGTPLCTY